MHLQTELLHNAKVKFPLSARVCEAFKALPRHKFVNVFSPDYIRWIKANAENMDLVYSDTTLLLYQKEGFVSTISQPSFVLRMLELLDLETGMKVFELGAGSGWNAALMGYLVGKEGSVKSYEIIPEMTKQAQEHIALFDLPQVTIIQGDALQEIWEIDNYDRGVFTAGAWDMPGILFDVMRVGGKFLFVLKTFQGDLLLAMERREDHFHVFEKIPCQFVNVTGTVLETYHNDLSELLSIKGEITVWPQGTINLGENIVAGREMIFKLH